MPVAPTVATLVLLLLHVPPVGVLLRVIVDPVHTEEGPDIGVGAFDIVTVVDTLQPAPNE
jgi:hypothetical protein